MNIHELCIEHYIGILTAIITMVAVFKRYFSIQERLSSISKSNSDIRLLLERILVNNEQNNKNLQRLLDKIR